MACCQKEKTTNSTQTTQLPAWVNQAGQQNYDWAKSLASEPFAAYTAPRVADLSPDQTAAFGAIRNAAATPNPYAGTAADLATGYATAPAQNFDFYRLIDDLPGQGGAGPAGSINDYMTPYLQGVLDPVMRQLAQQGQQQRLGINAAATNAGAFGDSRHGVVESEQRKNEMQIGTDATNRAYADAFNTAMGLKGQDLARMFQVQGANASAGETALNRQKAGAELLTNLDKYEVARLLGLTGAQGQAGAVQTGNDQAKLDAAFAEFMRQQQDPWAKLGNLSKLLAGTPTDKTTLGTSTTTEPTSVLGTAAGTALPMLLDFALPGAGTAMKLGTTMTSGMGGGGWNPNVAGGWDPTMGFV